MDRRHFLAALAACAAPVAGAATSPWSLLQRGGYVILMRHAATVPGIGDPPGFKLGVCSTQRNLSQAGRADATRIGAAFRKHGVPLGPVLSSRWCRCVDTARLAFGRVEPSEMVDSMFQDDDAARERKLAQLRTYLADYKDPGNLVLVTHDVNIRALVGKYVEQGDIVIAARSPDGALRIEATVPVAQLAS
jgi:phosphohistidine phosphatase SixA